GNDLDLNVAALGMFSVANNSCTLAGNPVALRRPASGTTTEHICLFSESGLDTSMSYFVSEPGDIAIILRQTLGLGIVRITLQIPATALPGARSLFIQNTNLDKAAASGALEVDKMSYRERRLFLWVIFLVGLLALELSAELAYATTLAPLRFEEL